MTKEEFGHSDQSTVVYFQQVLGRSEHIKRVIADTTQDDLKGTDLSNLRKRNANKAESILKEIEGIELLAEEMVPPMKKPFFGGELIVDEGKLKAFKKSFLDYFARMKEKLTVPVEVITA